MEQSPSWEANRFAASLEIPRVLWNPKVHHRIHKRPPAVSTLSQLNPVHTPTSYFLKIHVNIIFTSTSGSPQWSFSLRFPHQNPAHASPLPHLCYMPRPRHCSRFYRPHKIWWAVQIIMKVIHPIIPLLLGNRNSAWIQTSGAKQMRSAFFWVITQRVAVISYRRFGTIYQCSRLKNPSWILDHWRRDR
jgi:hypothetical protein